MKKSSITSPPHPPIPPAPKAFKCAPGATTIPSSIIAANKLRHNKHAKNSKKMHVKRFIKAVEHFKKENPNSELPSFAVKKLSSSKGYENVIPNTNTTEANRSSTDQNNRSESSSIVPPASTEPSAGVQNSPAASSQASTAPSQASPQQTSTASSNKNYAAMMSWGALLPNGQKDYPVHVHQARVLFHKKALAARFIGAIAGTGGGKTVIGPLWITEQIKKAMAKYGKVTGMIIAPTYKVLARATMPAFVETFRGTNLEGVYKESKSQYVLPNGMGVIWCQGADNPGGLEGGQFDFVWGDEGGQFKTKTFHAIEGRTGAKQSQFLVTTTPYGLGYLHDMWFTRWKAGDPDYFIEIWASNINPAYPPEEVERARRALPPHKFAERYLGIFAGAEGRVYETFHRSKVTMTHSDLMSLISSEGRFYGGLDFGWNDPFCGLVGILKPDDTLYVWWERYKSECTLEEHAEFLPKTHLLYNKVTRYAADHNPEAIKKLKRGGFTVVRAKKDILTGINAVNRRINTDKVKIIENRCPAVCGEAEQYRFPDKDEEIIGDKPVDENNHAMDALRYLIMDIDHRKAA